MLFAGFGALYSYGAFFLVLSKEFATTRAAVASIFSYAVFTLFMTGAISGMIADRYGPKRVVSFGTLAIALGLIGASYCTQFWQLVLCFTAGLGLGIGFVYVPCVASVQAWFERRRGFATGIAVTGIGMGTLLVPIVAGRLLVVVSWREVFLLFALMVVVLGSIAVYFVEADPRRRGLHPDGEACPPVGTRTRQNTQHLSAIVKSRAFVLFYLASTILSIPVFIPFVHLAAAAQDAGITSQSSVVILGLIGLGSTLGRFVVGGIADRYGRRRSLVLLLATIGASYTIWYHAHDVAMFGLFALIFGTAYGGYVALSPALLADYFLGPKLSSVIGIQYTAAGLGSIAGPVCAGYLFDITGSYALAIVIAALCGFAATGLVALMPEPGCAAA